MYPHQVATANALMQSSMANNLFAVPMLGSRHGEPDFGVVVIFVVNRLIQLILGLWSLHMRKHHTHVSRGLVA